MNAPQLGIDAEDLGLDIIPAIEKSFGFKFTQADLADVRSYGELCAAVQAKLPTAAATDCTTQQAFYKLRQAIRLHTATLPITPASQLADILPARWAQRREVAAAIEQSLGMKLPLFDMPSAVAAVGCLLLLFGCLLLAGGAFIGAPGVLGGLAGIAVAFILFDLGSRFGATLRYATVRDVVAAMSSMHYLQSRRNPTTVNPREIRDRLNYLFVDMAGVKLTELTPDAVL